MHSVLDQRKQWRKQYISIGKTDLFYNSMGLCGNFTSFCVLVDRRGTGMKRKANCECYQQTKAADTIWRFDISDMNSTQHLHESLILKVSKWMNRYTVWIWIIMKKKTDHWRWSHWRANTVCVVHAWVVSIILWRSNAIKVLNWRVDVEILVYFIMLKHYFELLGVSLDST